MHPNATASAFSAALVSLALYIASRCGVTLSGQDAAAVVGAVTTVVLWVGRRGIKAAALSLWRGTGKPDAPAA